jgi:O-acetyl-ADP-ribose deacetylase (regulator of RNase III)
MYLDGSRDKIIAWVAEGLSDARIAERVRVSESTVRYWRKRNGLERPKRRPAAEERPSMEWVAGDLFANEHLAQAIAHGCNCEGSMGAGVAKVVKARYPEMFAEYRRMCKAEPREFNPGDAWLWRARDQPHVFNLGTQERGWHGRATYEAIEESLRAMRRIADEEGLSRIAMPRIGAGYGGLSWKKVRAIIEQVFCDWSGTLIVYETFVPAAQPEA